MNWLQSLLVGLRASVAHIVCLYAFVISVGVYLGKIKIFGVSLGVTFVLFTGILMGHFGFTAEITHPTFHPRVRFDSICILYRSAGRSFVLLFVQERRDDAKHAGCRHRGILRHCCSTGHLFLRWKGRIDLPMIDWYPVRCCNQHARSGCCSTKP